MIGRKENLDMYKMAACLYFIIKPVVQCNILDDSFA